MSPKKRTRKPDKLSDGFNHVEKYFQTLVKSLGLY